MNHLKGRWSRSTSSSVRSAHWSARSCSRRRDGQQRFAIVDRFLIGRIADAALPPPPWTGLCPGCTSPTVPSRSARLTEEIGCSRRYLIQLFNDQVGLPPKLMARILRFERAQELAERGWCRVGRDRPALRLLRPGSHDPGFSAVHRALTVSAFRALKLPDAGGTVGD